MRCISKLIISLVSAWSAAPAAGVCALVDGARIRAADLVPFAPAFAVLPPGQDIGPAPSGTLVRVFSKAQLAAMLPAANGPLPGRLLPAADEPPPGRLLPAADEPPPARLFPAADEPPPARLFPAADEPPPARLFPAADEPPPARLFPAADEPPPGRLLPAADEPPPARLFPAADEPPPGRLLPAADEPPPGRLLPAAEAQLPDRLCVQRRREAIPVEAWQAAAESAMQRLCPTTPWKVKVIEAPHHRFPLGTIQLHRAGLVTARGPVQLWRGALVLPDKSSIPVWLRAELHSRRRGLILQRSLPAGSILAAQDYREEEVWAPGLCREGTDPPRIDGLALRRALPAGTGLLPDHFRRAPAVQRGHSVELEVSAGQAHLRLPAVAGHDAEIGETVKLKSTWNGTLLVGRVTGAQKATVD